MNGFTYDTPNKQKAANIIARLIAVASPEEAGTIVAECVRAHLEISDGFICDLDFLTRQEEAKKNSDIVTRETMELRSNEVSNALKNSDDLSAEQRESLWQELAEISNWLQKDDQQISDIGDAKLGIKYGNPL